MSAAHTTSEELAGVLELARTEGVTLHRDGEIGWLAIGPTGIHVIDDSVRAGLVERRFDSFGGQAGFRLLLDGRDRSRLVERVRDRADELRARLDGRGLAEVPVTAHLCVSGARWNRRRCAFDVDSVSITWPERLGEILTAGTGDADGSAPLPSLDAALLAG